MAGAAASAQERTPRSWLRVRPALAGWRRVPALAGAAFAIVLVTVLAFRALLPTTGPGATPTPAPTLPSPGATPEVRLLGDSRALRLRLGADFAPVDVIDAFNSIWVAGTHGFQVRRYDSASMVDTPGSLFHLRLASP